MHPVRLALAALLASTLAAPAADRAAVDAGFAAFLKTTVRPAARAAGVGEATLERALAGLHPDLDLPDLALPGAPATPKADVFQAEFTGPAAYLADAKLAGLAAGAARPSKRWRKTLAAVEARSGVPAGILLAVWGRESAFGAAAMPKEALRTLATQAYLGTRRELFLPELIAALTILDTEPIAPAALRSSWAGAMGQPQFLPSKFLAYAVDFDHDGRRDIWSSVPDTLASIGRFLDGHGWRAGLPWGVEVVVPSSVSCTLEGPDRTLALGDLLAAGVTRADGRPLTAAAAGPAVHLLMPAGRLGPAFLVSDNFYVLKAYNESDAYALFVGLVADRLDGAGTIRAPFAPLPAFTRGDVRDLQRRLAALGHDVGGVDGLVGFRTRVAIGREQEKRGLDPTCYPDPTLAAALGP